VLVLVLDGSAPLESEDETLLRDTEGRLRVVALNKSDLPDACYLGGAAQVGDAVRLSALTGNGLEELVRAIACKIGAAEASEAPSISNVRHLDVLERAAKSLEEAQDALAGLGRAPEELILSHISATRQALEELTGQRTSEDVLNEIFKRFCVGK
jgi:tRNA modification GTPase